MHLQGSDLLVVWPHAAFSRPPDLGRADLRAAFDLDRDGAEVLAPRR
jgi:hypothetical protein